MEYFILGLLMGQRLTAYDLHITIKNSLKDICSDSIGNIQRALKKLLAAEHVTVQSVIENEKNKKIYSLTPEGRNAFLQWLDNPIDIDKAKNMELSRLLLLGFLPREKQLANINAQIASLKTDYEYYLAIDKAMKARVIDEESIKDYFQQDPDYIEELLASLKEDNLEKAIMEFQKFNNLTLKFGLDNLKFYIDWFENLKREIEEEDENEK